MQIASMPLLASQPEFEFEIGSHTASELEVLKFEAQEEISRLFSVDVTLVAHAEFDASTLVGKPAVLAVQLGDGSARHFNGIAAQVKSWEEGEGPDRRRYAVQVVPALWTLGKIRRSRIFQNMTTPQIVKSVLAEGRVEFRAALAPDLDRDFVPSVRGYRPRDYCVQYRESDFDFVSRLLEEEGIFYFFEHTHDSHVMVLGDSPSVHEAIPGDDQVVFREQTGIVAETDFAFRFSAQLEIQSGKVMLRDFDPLRPKLDMDARRTSSAGRARGEESDGQKGVDETALEVYDYPGQYDNPEVGKAFAQIRLEQERLRANTASGSSVCRRLCSGYTFVLDGHPIPELNEEYLVISSAHWGHQPQVLLSGSSVDLLDMNPAKQPELYRNDFVCLPSGVPFRPERKTTPPEIAGPQTATVVGPAGEEIFTDAHGRVKVQFHWDREGRLDERSSCWIRVAQAWAGAGWGSLYLPRIGQEVVVEFLEGDPDRPIITGSVYNGSSPVPLDLPAEKTASVLRSHSSPGGGGSNELRFEDAAGAEKITVHAQRDLNIEIENDKTERIGGNDKLEVQFDRNREIGGNLSLQVGKNDTSRIQVNQSLEVGANRSTTVRGDHAETVLGSQEIGVQGSRSIAVAQNSSETVAFAKTLRVDGAYAVTVGGAMSEVVGHSKLEEVNDTKTEIVKGKKTETVTKSRTLDVGGDLVEMVGKSRTLDTDKDLTLAVGGKLQHTVTKDYLLEAKNIVLSAKESFTLVVGSATVEFKQSGDVVIKGANVEIDASGAIVLKGGKIVEN